MAHIQYGFQITDPGMEEPRTHAVDDAEAALREARGYRILQRARGLKVTAIAVSREIPDWAPMEPTSPEMTYGEAHWWLTGMGHADEEASSILVSMQQAGASLTSPNVEEWLEAHGM